MAGADDLDSHPTRPTAPLPPQVVEGRPYTRPADVWATGVLLYQMTALRLPFCAKSLAALAYAISQARYAPLPPPPTPPSTAKKASAASGVEAAATAAVRALVRSLLKKEPTERPTMEQILAEPSLAERLERIARHWPSHKSDSATGAKPHGLKTASGAEGASASAARVGSSKPHAPPEPAKPAPIAAPFSPDGPRDLEPRNHYQWPAGAPPRAPALAKATDGTARQQADAMATHLAALLLHLPAPGGEPLRPHAAPRHLTAGVSDSDAQVLLAACAEAGEALLAVARVHKAGRRSGKPSARVLGIGAQRMFLLAPRRKMDAVSLPSSSIFSIVGPRLKAAFWHDLLDATATPAADATSPMPDELRGVSEEETDRPPEELFDELSVEMIADLPTNKAPARATGLFWGGGRGREASTETHASLVLRFALPTHPAGAPPARSSALPPLFTERVQACRSHTPNNLYLGGTAGSAATPPGVGIGINRKTSGTGAHAPGDGHAAAAPEPYVLELLCPSGEAFDAILFTARRASAAVWRTVPQGWGSNSLGSGEAGSAGLPLRGDRWSAPASVAIRSIFTAASAAEASCLTGSSASAHTHKGPPSHHSASSSGSTAGATSVPPSSDAPSPLVRSNPKCEQPGPPNVASGAAAASTPFGANSSANSGLGTDSAVGVTVSHRRPPPLEAFCNAVGCLYAYHGMRAPRGLRRLLVAQLLASPPVLEISKTHAALAAALGAYWQDGSPEQAEAEAEVHGSRCKLEARALLVLARVALGAAACTGVTVEVRLGPCAGERSLASRMAHPSSVLSAAAAHDVVLSEAGQPGCWLHPDVVEACILAIRLSPRLLSLTLDGALAPAAAPRVAHALGEALPSALARLAHLGLGHNGALDEPSALHLLAGLHESPKALTSLNLSGCSLPPAAVPELCRLLSAPAWQRSLRSLSIGGNKSAALARELPAALSALHALEHLDVSNSGLDASHLLGELTTSSLLLSRLSSIKLAGVRLDQPATNRLAKLVGRAPRLALLDLAQTGISASMVDAVLAAALSSPSRRGSTIGLDLSSNAIAEGASSTLAHHLPHANSGTMGGTANGASSRLTSLLLRNCSLGESGVATIASLCAAHGALEHVDLSLNQTQRRFGWGRPASADPGAPLASMLVGCSGLRSLAVANAAGGRGGKGIACSRSSFVTLASAIAEHPSLTSLDLTGLKLDEASIADLVRMLPTNTSLLTLSLPPPPDLDAHHADTPCKPRDAVAAILQRNRAAAACHLALGEPIAGSGGKGGHSNERDTQASAAACTDRCSDPLVGHIERAAAFTVLAALARAVVRTPIAADCNGSNRSEKLPGSPPALADDSQGSASSGGRPTAPAGPIKRLLVDGPPQSATDYVHARAALSREHAACMKDLGVASAEIVPLGLKPRPPAGVAGGPPPVRIMSWSMLASAGADAQGFILRDVLDSEADSICAPLDAVAMASELVKDYAAGGAAAAAKFHRRLGSNQRVSLNHSVVVDWSRRWVRVRETIATLTPDVVCLQQLDQMGDALPAMRELGYECSLPGAEGYVPLVESGMASALHDSTDGTPSAEGYIAALTASGVAYAPSLSAAATTQACGSAENSEASDSSSIGSRRFARAVDEPGVAIFWRADTWEPATVEFLAVQRGSPANGTRGETVPASQSLSAAARVLLTRVSDGAPLAVMTARLPSGASAGAEAARVRELQTRAVSGNFDGCFCDAGPPSFEEWIASSAEEAPTALCLDASSAPQSAGETTVWRTLRAGKGAPSRSVWDSWFSPEGHPITAAGPLPITTNAVRSDPAANRQDPGVDVGLHVCACTDHIFFTEGLEAAAHAYGPVTAKTNRDALHSLLPSIAVPSDHYPVVVDFSFRSTIAPASNILAAAARRPSDGLSLIGVKPSSSRPNGDAGAVAPSA